VTAVAFVEGRFVEVDAVHMTKELLVLPRGHQHTVSQLDYFCSTISASSKPGMYDLWQYGLSSLQNIIEFWPKSTYSKEVIVPFE
jgi:hypothetical protein